MVNYKKIKEIVDKNSEKGLAYLVKDENMAKHEYRKIAKALEDAGFMAAAKKYYRMASDEEKHEKIQENILSKAAPKGAIISPSTGKPMMLEDESGNPMYAVVRKTKNPRDETPPRKKNPKK